MMTRQEMLNTAYEKLKQQGQHSLKSGMCYFRGEENRRCAIGWLIPDELYHTSLEGRGVTSIIALYPKICERLGENNIEFLQDVQFAMHDSIPTCSKKQFQKALDERTTEVAKKYGLINPAVTPTKEMT